MACFTNLSNELYFEILQYLAPPDLGSFFCINKQLYALTAIQRIRYSSLKRRFSTSLDTKQPGSTLRLIKSILVDPQIALYVQHFTINGPRDLRDGDIVEDQFGESEPSNFTRSELAQLGTILRDLDFQSLDEFQDWIGDWNQVPGEYLINLALTMFPNLTSIDIRYSRDFGNSTYQLEPLESMIFYYTDSQSSVGLFARLTSVTVSGLGDYRGDIDLIEAFVTLPSVKIINADRVISHTESLEAIVPEEGSNASDLNISNADLSPHRLTIHLQRFERLQSFTYWPTSDPQPRYEFDAFMIITALSANTQNFLRELHIRSGTPTPKYMGSWRKVRVLEYLETDSDLLFGPTLARNQTFSTSLPSSIKEVKLHGWRSLHVDLEALLLNLISAKDDFPCLRRIEFVETRIRRQRLTRLEVMFAKANISLRITDSEHVSLPIYTRHRGHYAERQAKQALTQRESL